MMKKREKNSQKDLIVYAVNMIVQNIVPRVFVTRFKLFFLARSMLQRFQEEKKF